MKPKRTKLPPKKLKTNEIGVLLITNEKEKLEIGLNESVMKNICVSIDCITLANVQTQL